MKIIVLDACSLIAYMRNEKGASLVHRFIYDRNIRVVLHAINFYEVYYDTLRQQPTLAHLIWDFVKQANIQIIHRLDKGIMTEGAIFKLHFKMSLADSIALGLASQLDATLLTADRHEFENLAKGKDVKIKFIR